MERPDLPQASAIGMSRIDIMHTADSGDRVTFRQPAVTRAKTKVEASVAAAQEVAWRRSWWLVRGAPGVGGGG